jgi:uncharacterized protein YciI
MGEKFGKGTLGILEQKIAKRVSGATRQADARRSAEFYHRIMYIALLTYTAPETEVDYALPDHSDWLRRQFAKGIFLVSGKGSGAADQVIVTRSVLRGKLDAVLASDPFVVQRLARYEVIEFTATRTAQELLAINEAIAS